MKHLSKMVGAFTMQGSKFMVYPKDGKENVQIWYKGDFKRRGLENDSEISFSRPLPKINKYFLGFFLEKEWMGDKAEAYYSENLSESGYKGLSGNRAYVYDRRNATKQRIPDAVTTCEMA